MKLILKKKFKLIHISTDGVYPSIKGNYSENGPIKPHNVYGWTKLCSEFIVKMLSSYVVIRTRFFDKTNIRFKTAATDIFTSMIEVQSLIKKIKLISLTKFNGVINVGERRNSDFENYKKFKPRIKPCKRRDILKNLSFEIAKDASMNLNLFKKLRKQIMDKVSLEIVVPIYNEGEKVIKLLDQFKILIKTQFRVLLCYDLDDDNIFSIQKRFKKI